MGTTFEDLEKNSAKKLTGIGVVIFLHVLVGLVLMTGLTKDIVKPSTEPVELVILQDIKPPEPEPPKEVPPDPPKMVEKVAQQPDPKPIEKAIPVQKTVATPVTKPTISTPTPVASSPSPSPSPTPTPTADAPSPAPKPTGVTRGVSEGEAGCKAPSYPREAEMSGISGTVLISVFVDTNGKAQEVKVKRSTGDRTLDRAATKAYSLCTFKPAMKDGVAQSAWFDIPYEFVLE